MAVNIEHTMPALNVTAKPLIGPEPIQASTNAAINIVTLASKIVMKALSKLWRQGKSIIPPLRKSHFHIIF